MKAKGYKQKIQSELGIGMHREINAILQSCDGNVATRTKILRLPPHYAGGIGNAAFFFFFLRLGLPSTLIRHENGAFRNALQTGGI